MTLDVKLMAAAQSIKIDALGHQSISLVLYLLKMPGLAKRVNTDLLNDFRVLQVAQKHGWSESLVWSQLMVNANDFDRFKALQCGFITGILK